jgi:Lon-like ATP-dependent protease
MIPARNVPHLMLRKDVVEEVEKGRFRVWAVSTVEEGIEILTGAAAGERTPGAAWPPESILGRVDARLRDLAARVKEFGPADLPEGS